MSLDKIPGIAFESQLSFSTEHIKASIEESKLKKKDFRKPEFALDDKEINYAMNYNKIAGDTKKKIAWTNVGKAFGYIPGPSIISGVCHIVQGASSKRFSAILIVRGILELLGIGFLLLIPDLITKAVRENKAKKELASTFATQIDNNTIFYNTVKKYVKAHFAQANLAKGQMASHIPLASQKTNDDFYDLVSQNKKFWPPLTFFFETEVLDYPYFLKNFKLSLINEKSYPSDEELLEKHKPVFYSLLTKYNIFENVEDWAPFIAEFEELLQKTGLAGHKSSMYWHLQAVFAHAPLFEQWSDKIINQKLEADKQKIDICLLHKLKTRLKAFFMLIAYAKPDVSSKDKNLVISDFLNNCLKIEASGSTKITLDEYLKAKKNEIWKLFSQHNFCEKPAVFGDFFKAFKQEILNQNFFNSTKNIDVSTKQKELFLYQNAMKKVWGIIKNQPEIQKMIFEHAQSNAQLLGLISEDFNKFVEIHAYDLKDFYGELFENLPNPDAHVSFYLERFAARTKVNLQKLSY